MAAALLILAPGASAAGPLTFTVNSNGDQADSTVGDGVCDVGAGVCTLRAAIQEANANSPQADTIDFSGASGQILLTSVLPQITDSVTVHGPGADQLAIDGDNTYRVLDIVSGITVSVSGLTTRHGQAPASATLAAGGGIVSSGDVKLDRVVVSENHAFVGGGSGANVNAFGGGIEAGGGTMTLIRSTVTNNTATAVANGADAQAVGEGGGIWLEGGTLHVVRSTIDSNQANGTVNAGTGGSLAAPAGGGIWMFQATVNIDESTIAGNSVTSAGGTNGAIANFSKGGGLYQDNLSSLTVTGATIDDNSVGTPGGPHDFNVGANIDLLTAGTFRDTIVADPVGTSNCSGAITSGGYNLEDDAPHSCHFTQATDISGQNPNLGPLTDNGGPTQTIALPSGSPAIDQGSSFGATTDQRGTGFSRISDSPAITNSDDGSDIGAFERDVAPPIVSAPVQTLIRGSQLGSSSALPIHFAWSASDDVTPVSQIQSFLQMRTNPSGTWSGFSTILGPTLAKGATPSLSGGVLRQFRVQANDKAANTGTGPPGPAFRITTYQETNPAIAYSGAWHQSSQSTASGGAVKYSAQAGAKATLTTTGRNLAVVMPRRAGEGAVKVCIDRGTPVAHCGNVDLSPATGLGARKLVFVGNGLGTAATHKVEVTVLSGRADLDGFVGLR